MLTLVLTVIFGLIFAYFATQNTEGVTMRFAEYNSAIIPLYLVVLGSLLVGLLLAWLINFINSIASSITLHGKESELKKAERMVAELTKRIHQLELENTRLKAENNEETLDDKSL